MTEQAREFLEKYYNGEYDVNTREDARTFAELSVEDRYEILKGHSKKIHPSVFIFAGKRGIVEILNSRFPRGTSLKEFAMELPDVYDQLYHLQPSEQEKIDYSKGWESVLGELNIFLDADGNRDENKIIEYIVNNPGQIPDAERLKQLGGDTNRNKSAAIEVSSLPPMMEQMTSPPSIAPIAPTIAPMSSLPSMPPRAPRMEQMTSPPSMPPMMEQMTSPPSTMPPKKMITPGAIEENTEGLRLAKFNEATVGINEAARENEAQIGQGQVDRENE